MVVGFIRIDHLPGVNDGDCPNQAQSAGFAVDLGCDGAISPESTS
jgi:hypothetical protein